MKLINNYITESEKTSGRLLAEFIWLKNLHKHNIKTTLNKIEREISTVSTVGNKTTWKWHVLI